MYQTSLITDNRLRKLLIKTKMSLLFSFTHFILSSKKVINSKQIGRNFCEKARMTKACNCGAIAIPRLRLQEFW